MVGSEWIKGWLTEKITQKTMDKLLEKHIKYEKPDFKYSIKRVSHELAKLSKKILKENFYPDVILGISGDNLVGGCIIGALLASPRYLRRPDRFRQIFRKQPLNNSIKKEILQKEWKNILLVDDESRSGETIRMMSNSLQDLFADANIKVAVVIVRSKSWHVLGEEFWKNHFFCYKDVPIEKDVHWPWEV